MELRDSDADLLSPREEGRGTYFGTNHHIGVDDLDGTLAQLARHGIEPESPRYQVVESGW